ncbi:MAG: cupin domain-containing protein [Planctomycetes bacterium]|nr:cupin domain-containing protein [Planctomycetota bacterium]
MRIPGLEVKVDAQAIAWRATRHPGVDWAPLHLAEGAAGPRESAVLIRMAPGCGYPPHRHVGVEEVLVLAGGYRDARGEHRAGTYLRYEAGSEHAPVALGDPDLPAGPGNEACLLFASARDGVVNLGAGS